MCQKTKVPVFTQKANLWKTFRGLRTLYNCDCGYKMETAKCARVEQVCLSIFCLKGWREEGEYCGSPGKKRLGSKKANGALGPTKGKQEGPGGPRRAQGSLGRPGERSPGPPEPWGGRSKS